MEFEVGETVFYDWIVGHVERVEIIKCYPNTDRYRIQHKNDFQSTVTASEVFRTEKELWQSKIDEIDNKIKRLEETREEYEKNIVRIHEAEE